MLLLLACSFDQLPVDTGVLALSDEALHVGRWSSLPAAGPVLAGSTFCASIVCPDCPEGVDLSCWDQKDTGSVEVLGADCISVDEGPGAWLFRVREDCSWEGARGERSRLTGVAVEDLSAGFEWLLRGMAEELNDSDAVVPADRAAFPLDLVPAEVRVLEGDTHLDVVLRHPDHEGPVGFSEPDLKLTLDAGAGFDWEVEEGPRLWLSPIGQGHVGQVEVQVQGRTLPVATITAVDVDDLESMDLVAGVYTDGSGPAALVVDLRDGVGRPILGGDVELVVDGDMVLRRAQFSGGRLWEDDQVIWFDDCLAPEQRAGPRSVTVTGSLAHVQDTVTLSWEGQAQESNPDWVRPEACPSEGGCRGCSSSPRRGWPALLGLLVLAVLRRQSSESSASSTQ